MTEDLSECRANKALCSTSPAPLTKKKNHIPVFAEIQKNDVKCERCQKFAANIRCGICIHVQHRNY